MNINRKLTNAMIKQLASSHNYEYRKLLLSYLHKFKKLQLQTNELMKEINNKEKLELTRKSTDFLKWFDERMEDKTKRISNKEGELAAQQFKLSDKEKLKIAYSRYYMAQRQIRDASDADKVLELVQKGYETIDELRELITGQKTSYRIAFSKKQNDGTISYYEKEASLKEILNLSTLEVTRKDLYKLRLQLTAEKREAWIQEKSTVNITDSYNNFLDLLKKNTNNTGNIGNKYEMYRKFMVARGTFVNMGQSDEVLLENIRQNVLANSKSFIEGVDHTYYDYNQGIVKFESLKSFIGGKPSLASLGTIMEGFNSIEKIINQSIDKSPEEIQKQLYQVMPPEQLENQIQFQVQAQMQQTIPDLVQQTFMQSGFGAYITNQ